MTTIAKAGRRDRFEQLASEWIADTSLHSSISKITQHRAFSEIVGMGEPAIPLILERMSEGDRHIHWFPALKIISGEDPVPPQCRGRILEMAQAWIDWGKRKKYLPA